MEVTVIDPKLLSMVQKIIKGLEDSGKNRPFVHKSRRDVAATEAVGYHLLARSHPLHSALAVESRSSAPVIPS